MGREVKETKATTNPEDAIPYVPDVGENRKDAAPFEVMILPLSGGEWQKEEADLGKITGRGNVNPVKRTNELFKSIIAKRVIAVKGYAVRAPSGTIVAPKNGAELVDALDHVDAFELEAVVNDLMGAIRDRSRLEAGAPNASRSPSAS